MEDKKRRGVNIPHDITKEILVKVPVKSLVRFKAVSKEWREAIESKCFVDKHMMYQKSLGGQVRLVEVKRIPLDTGTILERLSLETLLFMSTNGIVNISPYRLIRLRPFPFRSKISEPCDGLFCIYSKGRKFILLNPATNSQRLLPDPSTDVDESFWRKAYYLSLVGFGRENVVSPRYKLVWYFEVNNSTRCKVFALDSNTWRYVDPPNCLVNRYQSIIHLDGVLYCFGLYKEEKPHTTKLLAFDLHTETFQSFSVTPDIPYRCSICVLNHRLCIFKKHHFITTGNGLFQETSSRTIFKIWGLDINKRSWEIMYSIDLSRLPPDFDGIRPVATIKNFVILSNYDRTIWVLYGSNIHIFRNCNLSVILRRGEPAMSRSEMISRYFKKKARLEPINFFETLVSVYQ